MSSYLLLAAQGTDEKKVLQRGLYVFPREGDIFSDVNHQKAHIVIPSANAVPSTNPEKDKKESIPVLTPRSLGRVGKMLYAITREGIYGYSINSLATSIDSLATFPHRNPRPEISAEVQVRLEDLLGGLAPESLVKGLAGDKTLTASFRTAAAGFFLSLFATDPLRYNLQPGLLVYSPAQKLEKSSLELISAGNHPNHFLGEAISVGLESVLACTTEPSRGLYLWERERSSAGASWKSRYVNSISAENNILSLSSLRLPQPQHLADGQDVAEIFALTDNRAGYVLFDSRTFHNPQQGSVSYTLLEHEKLFTHDAAQFLPSEATSSALFCYNNKIYALFGCDDGYLVVMGVELTTAGPQTHFYHAFSLISLERQAANNLKDYHIRNLQVVPGETPWIRFTMANLYAEMSASALLEQDSHVRLSAADEKQPAERGYFGYLQQLKKQFSLHQLCAVPHRINGFEEIEV